MTRRLAAWLSVLLAHALAILWLLGMDRVMPGDRHAGDVVPVPITLLPDLPQPEEIPEQSAAPAVLPGMARRRRAAVVLKPAAPGAITPTPRVDWSSEVPKAAARELARQAEAERESKKFSGPQATWPSLTRRQPSKVGKVPWKPGIDGPEYDEQGNPIIRPTDGCYLTGAGTSSTLMLTCALGKPEAKGDMFKEMREYFDEQRLPETKDGNGTEPEAKRPAR